MEEKVVFIDRDGVICKEVEFLRSHDQIKLIDGSAEAIKLLNDAGYKTIVVTNQPVVARKMCTEEDINFFHIHLNELIRLESDGLINDFFYCPHHPTIGDNPSFTCECNCRKPKPGMILNAAKEYGLSDLKKCFMIGDKISDIKAGRDAGCKTILVKTGYAGKEGFRDAKPDYYSKDLLNAVSEIILKK